jgi:Ca2+-binding RTX toxin-like protein
MAKAISKIGVKGTRSADLITVDSAGVTVNGRFTPYTPTQIANGFSINGDAGNDTISGGLGPDDLSGFSGDDRLIGGAGYDRLSGQDGNDVLVDSADGAFFDGGRGNDTIDLSASSGGVGLLVANTSGTWSNIAFSYDSLTNPEVTITGGTYRQNVSGVENAVGGDGADLLRIWQPYVTGAKVSGGGGADHLEGLVLDGGAGDDVIWGKAGDNILTGGTGADRFFFQINNGNDTVLDFSAAEGDLLIFSNSEGRYQDVPLVWNEVRDATTNEVIGMRGDFQGASVTLMGVTAEMMPSIIQNSIIHSPDWIFT